MKKLVPLLALFSLFSCSSDNVRYKNPYLPSYSFSIDINLGLPTYNGLTIPMNPVYVNNGTSGVRGLIVMRVSSTDYRAWEASCPNHAPSSCSTMQIEGLTAVCSCEENTYSLFDGTGPYEYGMMPYRVQVVNANAIRVYN